MTGVSQNKELLTLLEKEKIHSIQAAMRHKELAKFGDPLTNWLFSLAYSHFSNRFYGEKVSGKILAAALRLANLRRLAPSRLDAHGLGDCVEAIIAYGWLRRFFTISDAAKLLLEQFRKEGLESAQPKALREDIIARAFSVFLKQIWQQEQTIV